VLRAIKTYDIATKRCSDIPSADIIAFANRDGFAKLNAATTSRKIGLN
jgi:hypothetical protein